MQSIVIVNSTKRWKLDIPEVEIITVKDYLTDLRFASLKNIRVYNLCQSFRYQSMGYYASLLAEARGHRCFPDITTIQDLKSQSIIRIISDELDKQIQTSLARIKSPKFILEIYFGKSISKQHQNLAKQLSNLFQSPLLSVHFCWSDDQNKWLLQNIFPLPLNQISESQKPYLIEFAHDYFSRKRIPSRKKSIKSIYDLAILYNPEEKSSPSNKKAIKKFIAAAEKMNMRVRLITKNDYSRIPEFDALLIRETTAANSHTYRFARRALAENLVVIDDPTSIVKCANKVYMAEVLKKAKIPTPKTFIVHKSNKDDTLKHLDFPIVLKQPDGSFSSGVTKVTNTIELEDELNKLLSQSDLIIAQAYSPTEYDWRIGVLNKKALYACKYYMTKNHWQIRETKDGKVKEGKHETVPINQVPAKVVKIAEQAASLIGDGLYGVDLKQQEENIVVIEINDNPNIDGGVEDQVLKDKLYLNIVQHIVNKIKARDNATQTSMKTTEGSI